MRVKTKFRLGRINTLVTTEGLSFSAACTRLGISDSAKGYYRPLFNRLYKGTSPQAQPTTTSTRSTEESDLIELQLKNSKGIVTYIGPRARAVAALTPYIC